MRAFGWQRKGKNCQHDREHDVGETSRQQTGPAQEARETAVLKRQDRDTCFGAVMVHQSK